MFGVFINTSCERGLILYVGWDLLARYNACKASRSIVPLQLMRRMVDFESFKILPV
jgi:hypothetical protein